MVAPRAVQAGGRLDGLVLPEGGAWATAAREAAFARLKAMGLPGRRDEYWKYTDPTSLVAEAVTPAAAGEADAGFGVEAVEIVFVDGVFDPAASGDLSAAGVEIVALAEAAARDIHWARELYGVLEERGQSPVARPLAALNTALATEGVVIHARGAAKRPVSLVYRHVSPTSDAVLHHLVKLDPGADLTVLESGPGAARFNSVLEVEVADGASFHHVRTQGPDEARRVATHLFARLGNASRLKSFTLTANGVLTRNEAVVEIAGDDAVAHVAGATMGDAGTHHDDTVFITHAGERGESRQVFKKVLMGGAVGVFQGKILVKQGAQKTDGYQISQSLLLDERSQFLAKPELEIYADDVKCSHGSTSGAIDEEGLFYLRSRGVPERQAQALLVLAFLAEAIGEIEDAALAEDIRARLEAWLGRRMG